jgi:dihydropteroate synthase
LLVGTSRKSFLGTLLKPKTEKDRIWGTAATVVASVMQGAHIVRVHDVAEMVQVVRVADVMQSPELLRDRRTRSR